MLEEGERGRHKKDLTYTAYSLHARHHSWHFLFIMVGDGTHYPTHDDSFWIKEEPPGYTVTFSPAPSLTSPQGDGMSHLLAGLGEEPQA